MWNEAKTPQEKRWRSVVVSDSEGVVWVEDFWRIQKEQCRTKTANELRWIEIKEDNR